MVAPLPGAPQRLVLPRDPQRAIRQLDRRRYPSLHAPQRAGQTPDDADRNGWLRRIHGRGVLVLPRAPDSEHRIPAALQIPRLPHTPPARSLRRADMRRHAPADRPARAVRTEDLSGAQRRMARDMGHILLRSRRPVPHMGSTHTPALGADAGILRLPLLRRHTAFLRNEQRRPDAGCADAPAHRDRRIPHGAPYSHPHRRPRLEAAAAPRLHRRQHDRDLRIPHNRLQGREPGKDRMVRASFRTDRVPHGDP